MNAYQKSIELNLPISTEEEVASCVLALKSITLRPINLAYLMEMLNFRGMLRKTDGSGGQERWQGTLQNLKAILVAMNLQDKVAAYEMWFSHVTNPRQVTWDTTKPQWAIAFSEMKATFAGVNSCPSLEDFEAVVQLGGGCPYHDLTAEQLLEQKTNAELNAAIELEISNGMSVVHAKINAVDDAARTASRAEGVTAQSIIDAAQVAWGST